MTCIGESARSSVNIPFLKSPVDFKDIPRSLTAIIESHRVRIIKRFQIRFFAHISHY